MSKRREPEPLIKERIRADHTAAIFGIEVRTVQAMAKRGELPVAAKIGGIWTFDEASIRAYVQERVAYYSTPPAQRRALSPNERGTRRRPLMRPCGICGGMAA